MTDAVGYLIALVLLGGAGYFAFKQWKKRRLSKVDFDVGTPTAPGGGNPRKEPGDTKIP